MAKKSTILTDTLETLKDAGKDIGKDTVKGVATVADINSFLYGARNETPEKQHEKAERAIKEFGINEKTKKENEEIKKANATPVDVQALRDKQQMDEIRKRLFEHQKKEEKEADAFFKEKDMRRKQMDQEEEEKKKKEKEQQEHAAPPEDAHGKEKGQLGKPKKKASTDPHQNFEQKANKGK